MKTLVTSLAIALALAFAAPAAFAGDASKATTKADCDKAGGVWDASAQKCGTKGY